MSENSKLSDVFAFLQNLSVDELVFFEFTEKISPFIFQEEGEDVVSRQDLGKVLSSEVAEVFLSAIPRQELFVEDAEDADKDCIARLSAAMWKMKKELASVADTTND